MAKQEISNKELLETINDSFTDLEGKMGKQFMEIKATMVTKDYLDEKLADLRGDLVVLMRKEDRKLKTLIEILKERKVISRKDEEKILAMEPFPQLYL